MKRVSSSVITFNPFSPKHTNQLLTLLAELLVAWNLGVAFGNRTEEKEKKLVWFLMTKQSTRGRGLVAKKGGGGGGVRDGT